MYIVTPFPNLAYALDLTKAGAPIKWSYDPKPDAAGDRQGLLRRRQPRLRLCRRQADLQPARRPHDRGRCQDRQGGLAHEDGRRDHGVTMTMAPFVVGDKVYVGNSGGELGVWGWLAALDVKTGKELWRAHSTRHRQATCRSAPTSSRSIRG